MPANRGLSKAAGPADDGGVYDQQAVDQFLVADLEAAADAVREEIGGAE